MTKKDQEDKQGRTVLITGVSRGIGQALFLAFGRLEETCVIGLARNADALNELRTKCRQEGLSDCHLFAHDLLKKELPGALLALLAERGSLDVLINNAGAIVNKPFAEITEDDWLRCYQTNVYAPYHLIQQVISYLQQSTLSHVVNIGSMGGVQGSSKFPGLSAYSSSKAALIGMTECLAEEYSDSSVRFNCVNLGAVQTEMLAEAFPGYRANHHPGEVADWIMEFALRGGRLMNGKSVQLSDSTP
jgi:NAD(P)-dependent dehydrogenase (short-subunit alcohol dehydrogenase family)